MKKLFIAVSLFAFFALSSCKVSSSHCAAYSKVEVVKTGKSI